MGKKKIDLVERKQEMSNDAIERTLDEHERRIRLLEENNKLLTKIDLKVENMEKNVGAINSKLKEKDDEKQKDIKGWIKFFLEAILTILIGYIAIKVGLK